MNDNRGGSFNQYDTSYDPNQFNQGYTPSENSYDEYDYEDDKSHKGVMIGCAAAVLILALGAGGFFWFCSNRSNNANNEPKLNADLQFVSSQTIELGEPVILDARNFLANGSALDSSTEIRLKTDLMSDSGSYEYNSQTKEVRSKGKDYLEKGKYPMILETDKGQQEVTLVVKDSKAPEFIGFSDRISIEQNAQNVRLNEYWAAKDLDKATIQVSGNVDLKTPGEYKVKVIATDPSGNKTTKDATVIVVETKKVAVGTPLTKTKTGDLPLSGKTADLISNNKINKVQSDQNEQKILAAQKQFEEEMRKAREEVLIKKNQNGWFENGTIYKTSGEPVTGHQTIDNKQFFFNEDGVKQIGWMEFAGGKYYYKEDGLISDSVAEIDGAVYRFDVNGRMMTGWLGDDSGMYYYNPESGRRQYGEATIAGADYYFDEATGARFSGFRTAEGRTFYYDQEGKKLFGEQTINGATYYFDKEFNGTMSTGMMTITDQTSEDGKTKTVLLDEKGNMIYGLHEVDGKMYFFDANHGGAMQKGIVKIPAENEQSFDRIFYFSKVTGEKTTGFITEEDKIYYFNPQRGGSMTFGMVTIHDDKNDKDHLYCFDENGVRITGWKEVGQNVYYFLEENGRAVKSELKEIDGKMYQFDEEGKRVSGLYTSEGVETYFDQDGVQIKNQVVTTDKGEVIILNDKGIRISEGLLTIDTKTHYYLSDGTKFKNGEKHIDGSVYCFDENGELTRILTEQEWIDQKAVL